MADDVHKDGVRKGEFCTLRTESPCDDCPFDQNYQDVCKPDGWATFSFVQARKIEGKRKKQRYDRTYEAHHVLCVASVQKAIIENDAWPPVEQTKWCINGGINMIAMPLFGHTIKHYCELENRGVGIKNLIAEAMEEDSPPQFANIPQHDFDHYRWNVEIETEVGQAISQVVEAEHGFEPEKLAKKLDGLSNKFMAQLKPGQGSRGKRNQGTHESWLAASSGGPAGANWYLPFSMALTGEAEKRPAVRRDWKKRVNDKFRSLLSYLPR